MADHSPEELLNSLRPDSDGGPESIESLAAKLPGFSREAVEEALRMLCLSGVLDKETDAEGRTVYRYAHPERYRMVNASDLKQPGPEFGRR